MALDQNPVTRRKGYWKCTNCTNVETFEREVYCWSCGVGEMVYTHPSPPRLYVVPKVKQDNGS